MVVLDSIGIHIEMGGAVGLKKLLFSLTANGARLLNVKVEVRGPTNQ